MSHISPLSHLGLLACATAIFFGTLQLPTQAADPKPVKILFLGDKGHHRPSVMASKIVDPLMANGIEIEYTEDVNVLRKDSPELAGHDGLMIYANIEKITPEQESALLAYVASGKGFIPVHCASFCFLNSEKYVELVGAQFKEHGGQKFTTVISAPDHPIMKDFSGFESWDETYTHHRHNANNRTVLEERVQGAHPKGVDSEPWSWVRTHGKGRVFYTAWGHDERTWNQPGFINLLSRGIRWACQADLSNVAAFQDTSRFPVPKMTSVSKDVAPFSFTDVGAQIPNYTPGPKWGAQDKPLTLMQDPLPPKESIKHYVTPEGFSMKLWTNEAASSDNKKGLVGKPIAMNWDERGRLWVCETIDYPNELKEQGQGRDTIRICEDTDKDGLADKFTVFA